MPLVSGLVPARIARPSNIPLPGLDVMARRLSPETVAEETRLARKDGQDNLVLRSAGDTWLLSRTSLPGRTAREGDRLLLEVEGKRIEGVVTATDDEVNHDADVLRGSLPCALPGAILGALLGRGAGAVVGGSLGTAACQAVLVHQQLRNTRPY